MLPYVLFFHRDVGPADQMLCIRFRYVVMVYSGVSTETHAFEAKIPLVITSTSDNPYINLAFEDWLVPPGE